ncbi:MAG: hypothetical protein C0618_03820 [Desulfuromonas sp.]|nr:MAG: hypothetical protein C0618_03820 [Desulfuromonas sp.]
MTPSDVKRYLSERRVAPLDDIATHFDLEPDTVRGMLSLWVRKGKVRKHQDDGCGGSGQCCGGCGSHASKEIYEWLN